MKVIFCCLFLAASFGDHGKASFDSITPFSGNVLEDTTRSSDSSCNRPCKFNVKPRRCHYNFRIEPNFNEDGTTTISVNGITPGPPINVCVRDIVVVEVQNKVPDQDIAIHWHGVEQRGTPYMDGVPMVTQCPITYGSTFKYAFRASTPGTYFYHSDSVTHQSDGVYGALVINQPQPLEHHSSLYDYDRSEEHTLIIGAKFPELLTGNLEDLSRLRPTSLVINGFQNKSKIFVISSFGYRLRLINAIAQECPVSVQIENHEMLVIASDGKPVRPLAARKVRLYPGERMDVVVRASKAVGGYWIRAQASGACAGVHADAMMLYSGFNYTSMLNDVQKVDITDDDTDEVYGQKLESIQSASHPTGLRSVYLGIDKNVVKYNDNDNDYRYISDAIPKKPFFPASLSLRDNGVVQINGKSFLYPNTPLLLKSRDPSKTSVCQVGAEVDNQEPQCLHVLNAREGQVVELSMVNEGFGSNDSYTFHMHGSSMQVVSTWKDPHGAPLSKQEFQTLDKNGQIKRNLESPALKDTVTVPNKGYTIVRIRLEQGGSWLLECRACSLFSLPSAIVINVPLSLPKSVSESFPRCGNYRPPDVLLN